MDDRELQWRELGAKTVFRSPVFDIRARDCVSGDGMRGTYFAVDAPDWVTVIPEKGNDFVLVRQWRHGSTSMLTEFPGGMVDKGEDPAKAAARELEEETGYRAGKLTKLGSVNPNPALFTNVFHVFLAEELTDTGKQSLDADERIDRLTLPAKEVIARFGSGEFVNAFMGTALCLYQREKNLFRDEERH